MNPRGREKGWKAAATFLFVNRAVVTADKFVGYPSLNRLL
jgi:hypothetical protein